MEVPVTPEGLYAAFVQGWRSKPLRWDSDESWTGQALAIFRGLGKSLGYVVYPDKPDKSQPDGLERTRPEYLLIGHRLNCERPE